MAISILTNIASLSTQRYFERSTEALSNSAEKLSSGLRINRPSDDAAGLAVSEGLRVDSSVAGQAARNISDGISALEVANGALNSIGTLLTRMAELAEQSANGTLSNTQRGALEDEFQELSREVQRITDTTSFNNIDLLSGEVTTATSNGISGLFSSAPDISADGRYVLGTRTSVPPTMRLYDTDDGSFIDIGGNNVVGGRLDASGTRVIYEDIDGNGELFFYDVTTGQTTQITDARGAETYEGYDISADGSTVYFTARTVYDSEGTGQAITASTYVYQLDLETNTYTRLNNALTNVQNNSLNASADGSRVSFTSTSNLVGENSGGDVVAYAADFSGSEPSVNQISNIPAIQVQDLRIANDGDAYFLAKNAFYKYDAGSDSASVLYQGPGASIVLDSFRLSNDEQSLYLVTDDAVVSGNTTRQPFRIDTDSGEISEIATVGSFGSTAITISADGNTAVAAAIGGLNIFDVAAASQNLTIDSGSGDPGEISLLLQSVKGTLTGLGGFTISSQRAASFSLDGVQNAIAALGGIQGTIGAGVSRLESAFSVLESQRLELTSARSRITDADVAEEAANLAKNQILQQAGAAVLGQANSSTELALLLLDV